ncbi:HU family DNA-binding protein [Pseudoroseomonas globiformis]|uniref:HU family DNA-binding protein n=1 Tax=Teichococcus globiformis TaxID=2307229 RepID=A0ABV7G7T0_9PROT
MAGAILPHPTGFCRVQQSWGLHGSRRLCFGCMTDLKGKTMSKKFLADTIQKSIEITGVGATALAGDIIEAIKNEIIQTGRFTIPEFGAFSVRETPKRTAMNPRTGEKVAVKASATVRFKPSPALREGAFTALKKNKRKAARAAG